MRGNTRNVWLAAMGLTLVACSRTPAVTAPRLTVAAAANLTGVMNDIAREFEQETQIPVIVSYGSTAQLAQQIDSGAPFDVFAAADTEHVDALIEKGRLKPESRAVYARGQLAVWFPDASERIYSIEAVGHPAIRFIAVAQPDLAPYGRATVEALKAVKIWEHVRPKITYASSISMAKQYASSGNADAAFTSYSLVLHERGVVLKVDPRLYRPIDQALAITSSTGRADDARRFTRFVLGDRVRALLSKNGYVQP